MYIVTSDLFCWECWWNSWRKCRWKPICNVNFTDRWGWSARVICLYAALPNRRLCLPIKIGFLRKETLQGFVHDEASAFFGGLGGNAGLFSTAREVARIYQMLLNRGELDGQRYLSKETCQLFTTEVSKISRRGLGFD